MRAARRVELRFGSARNADVRSRSDFGRCRAICINFRSQPCNCANAATQGYRKSSIAVLRSTSRKLLERGDCCLIESAIDVAGVVA